MKRRLFLAAIAPLAIARAEAQAAWSDYRSEEANFHVQLPGPPKLSTASVAVGKNETAPLTEAVVSAPGATYQAVCISYPRSFASTASADVMLDSFRNNLSTGLAYRNESKITLGRFSGREFVLVQSEQRHSAVRLYWARGRLYQLLVTGTPGVEARPDTRKFFDSFALNNA